VVSKLFSGPRLCHTGLNVYVVRYVPKPKPGVFRITKNIHNILQGVSDPTERISSADMDVVSSWIVDNANRSWLSPGGPLRPPEEGGADVIMVRIVPQIWVQKPSSYLPNRINRLMTHKCPVSFLSLRRLRPTDRFSTVVIFKLGVTSFRKLAHLKLKFGSIYGLIFDTPTCS
jgi:hypothetical protein